MTDLTFYKYKVQWYDTDDYKIHDLCGVTIGESYSDAFARILDYYGGEREVISLYIEAWDVSQCLEMQPEVLRAVEFDDSDPTPAATAKSLDVNLDFTAAKIAECDKEVCDDTPLAGVVGPNDKICGANTTSLVQAYVDGHPEVYFYGSSIDSIRQTNWFDRTSCEYGVENIIFKEDDFYVC